MGIKITRDGNIIKASGWPAGSIIGFVFGILFLIVGVLTIFANTTVSLVIIILSNIILYASRRHGNGARNRKLIEEVEKDRQRNLIEMEEKTRLENKRNFSDGHDTKYGIDEELEDAKRALANDEKKLADLEREKQKRNKKKFSEKEQKEIEDQDKIEEYRLKGERVRLGEDPRNKNDDDTNQGEK